MACNLYVDTSLDVVLPRTVLRSRQAITGSQDQR